MNITCGHLLRVARGQTLAGAISVRYARGIKPWNIGPEGAWKKARSRKVIKIELPDFNEMRLEDKLSPEEIRSRLKEKGVAPPRMYNERELTITSTNGILDPYVPPEGDGKASIISATGAKQRMDQLTKKGKSMLAIRKVRTYEDELDLPTFAENALDLYVKAHRALADKEWDQLHDFVTEHAFPQMTHKADLKTIRWQFINSIEKPTVAHVRTLDVLSKNNLFAQITVRLHTRQILAIYDRFGILMHGSEAVVKDVLEYVVFEKHLANLYGKWRLHAKIVPNWMPPKEPIIRTFVSPPALPPKTEREILYEKDGIISDQKSKDKDDSKQIGSGSDGKHTGPQPAIA
ncbi:probable 39S ribosomal protein L45, mitochondrial [Oppia nitens]|uniref:probable 39S ribosomal protein L45, mitochondrial n=1 Tax=Oppia nitens TaxID=1686743 RepID=UPI0023DABECC|nr:probable 39S ribosomal protein L45, mitochondrial [Oppia nitens]